MRLDNTEPADFVPPELAHVVNACRDYLNGVGVPVMSRALLAETVVALADLAGVDDPLGPGDAA